MSRVMMKQLLVAAWADDVEGLHSRGGLLRSILIPRCGWRVWCTSRSHAWDSIAVAQCNEKRVKLRKSVQLFF
jgi:hypothetical protein